MEQHRIEGMLSRNHAEALLQGLNARTIESVRMGSCHGGDADFLWRFKDDLGTHTFTTVGGNISGMAVALFLLGTRRFVYQKAKFHFSDFVVSSTPRGPLSLSETLCFQGEPLLDKYRHEDIMKMRREASFLRHHRSVFISFVAARTGQPRSSILKLMEENATLDTQKLMALGFAHDVVTHQPPKSSVPSDPS